MKEARYSALWVLAPLCVALVALTGGMLFLGWFARDFDLPPHAPVLIAAFVASFVIGIGVVGGYLAVLRGSVRPDVLWFSLTGLLFIFLCALAIGFLVDAVTGHAPSLFLAIGVSLLAAFFGILLKRRIARR